MAAAWIEMCCEAGDERGRVSSCYVVVIPEPLQLYQNDGGWRLYFDA